MPFGCICWHYLHRVPVAKRTYELVGEAEHFLGQVWGYWVTFLKDARAILHQRFQSRSQHTLYNVDLPSSVNENYWDQKLVKFLLMKIIIKPRICSGKMPGSVG